MQDFLKQVHVEGMLNSESLHEIRYHKIYEMHSKKNYVRVYNKSN